MKAPDKIYLHGYPDKPFLCQDWDVAPTMRVVRGKQAENIAYIRADLAEQPETDLLEEAYMRGFAQGAKEERKDLAPLINRLCEAILFEWKDAADLARKTLTQIKEREEEKWHEKV